MRPLSPADDDAHCGWLNFLSPPPPVDRLTGSQRVDCVVVGAGFTGLAIARRLAQQRPQWIIAVLDGQRAGHGASGRSSGFVVDLAAFISQLPPETAEAVIRLSRFGIGLLRQQVAALAIDCAWDDRGWLHGAATPDGQRSLGRLRSWLEGRGEAFESLDAAALEAALGTPYYRAGIRLPGSVLVQPAALARGLAENLPANVRLYEESPVLALEKGRPWTLRCAAGEVRSDRVFLATNAALASTRPTASRVFPLITFGSLTRILTTEEQAALGGEKEWGILAQEPLGSSVRRTRDQRILIRNTSRYRRQPAATAEDRTAAALAHRRAFLDRFPQLESVDFEATWAGTLAMTADHGIVFGPLATGLFAAGGYSGAGIALAAAAGRLLADQALNESSPELEAFAALPRPRWIPPQPFLGLGVRWHLSRLEAKSGGKI